MSGTRNEEERIKFFKLTNQRKIYIIIMGTVFILTWNTFDRLENNLYKMIGIPAIFIGIIDLFHTLSYKGMNIFLGYDANLPTQFWIAARFFQAITIILGVATRKSIRSKYHLLLILSALTLASIVLPLIGFFPTAFIEGTGLTPFKKIMEYLISGILAVSCLILYKKKNEFDKTIYLFFQLALLSSIFSEIAFTFYIDVFDISNIFGHLLKIVTYVLFYKAILEVAIRRPQQNIYFELKNREEKLQKALEEINNLQGLLPICSSCKKIRNDDGFWQQVEDYFLKHSDVKFSHGICPDCAKQLYPEYA